MTSGVLAVKQKEALDSNTTPSKEPMVKDTSNVDPKDTGWCWIHPLDHPGPHDGQHKRRPDCQWWFQLTDET